MGIAQKILETELLHSDILRSFVPSSLKKFIKCNIPYIDYRRMQLRREAERKLGGEIPVASDYQSPYDFAVGVLLDRSYAFSYNIAACHNLKVRFKVLDLMADNWQQLVEESGCEIFMSTPDSLFHIYRQIHEERLWVLTHDLKKRICPSFEELYLWESKRRMNDWLVAHNIPHPETSVFCDQNDALAFCREAEYPLVFKTDRGAASSGVLILKNPKEACRIVKKVFSKGILRHASHKMEREWGCVLFQEYIPHQYEWRIIRIGDSFICRRKTKAGDFASGSGCIDWAAPLSGMLDFAKQVTDDGGFTSMAVDIFAPNEKGDNLLVNELQALFGAKEITANDNMGRFMANKRNKAWDFKPGFFCQNTCANLRLKMLLEEHEIAIDKTGTGAL